MSYLYILNNRYYFKENPLYPQGNSFEEHRADREGIKQYLEIYIIGSTSKHPAEKANELSSQTGVLDKFNIKYWIKFTDKKSAEQFVYKKLEEFRLESNKDFFKVDLYIAIEILKSAFVFFEKREPNKDDFYMQE